MTSAPNLGDGVVVLRSLAEQDVPRIVEQCRDPETIRWVPVPTPYGVEDARAFLASAHRGWAEGSGRVWAIAEASDPGRFLGSIDYRPESGFAFVGYGLHPDARGRDLAARALRLVVDHAFEVDRLERLHWRAVVGNWGSRRTAWSVGFVSHGTLPGSMHLHGRIVDGWAASLHRDDPRSPQTPWFAVPVRRGERCVLRPFRDHEALPAERDALSERFLHDLVPTSNEFPGWLAERRERMAGGRAVHWCIADPDDDRLLGAIHLFRMGDGWRTGAASLGYWLVPSARGRAVMAEAIDLVTAYAFGDEQAGGLGLRRIEATVDLHNSASASTLRRAGFRLVGVRERDIVYADGRVGDVALVERLPGEQGPHHWGPIAQPELVDGDLSLSPFTTADLAAMAELLREDDVGWPMGAADADETSADRWLRRLEELAFARRQACWAIRVDGVPIGTVRAFRLDDPSEAGFAEIGYWVRESCRRRGFASRAVRLLLPHLRAAEEDGGAGYPRVAAVTDADNTASQAVLSACGFRRWGDVDGDRHFRFDGDLST